MNRKIYNASSKVLEDFSILTNKSISTYIDFKHKYQNTLLHPKKFHKLFHPEALK